MDLVRMKIMFLFFMMMYGLTEAGNTHTHISSFKSFSTKY
jgi:hypothetical protein